MAYRRNRKRPLNVRQQKFVEQFLLTGIGREAAIRAGYSAKGATESACRLRRLPYIAEAIRQGRAAEARRAQVARERVLLELARVAFADIGDVLDWTGADDITLRPKDQISPHHRAAIAELAAPREGAGLRVKLHSKSRAIDALARHLGVFDKIVPAVPPPYARKDGRDARTILLERLKRLAETGASLAAGAPLGIPSTLAPLAGRGQGEGSPAADTENPSPPSSFSPSPPERGRGQGEGVIRWRTRSC
ncbi:MAG: terminase small subunit [Alphaproteobacteria bacterium]|nr:terminase small subunit [Alphaproteobacteria bacterium]